MIGRYVRIIYNYCIHASVHIAYMKYVLCFKKQKNNVMLYFYGVVRYKTRK